MIRHRARIRTAAAGICATALAFAAGAQAQDPGAPGETLTLERAIALALENDPRVRNATLQVERAQKSLAAARTRRLPDFDLQVQASQLLTPVTMTFPAGAFGTVDPIGPIPAEPARVESGTDGVVSVTGRITQPLTQQRRIGLDIHRSALGRDIERERLRAERLSVVNEVRRTYYAIQGTEHALVAALEQLQAEHELERLVATEREREVVLPAAVMEVEARRIAQDYSVLRLRDDAALYKEQLNMLLGRPVDTAFAVEDLADAMPPDLDVQAAEQRALQQRPDLSQARMQLTLAEAERRRKRSEYIPDVSLALTYQSFFNVELLPRDVTQLGLLLQWEPFDWGRKHQEMGDKARAVAQAKNSLDAARDQARVEVRDRCRKAGEARALVDARRAALTAAREKARVAANQRAEEAALLSDALQAQAAAADASSQYQQALLALWTARADLEEVIGENP